MGEHDYSGFDRVYNPRPDGGEFPNPAQNNQTERGSTLKIVLTPPDTINSVKSLLRNSGDDFSRLQPSKDKAIAELLLSVHPADRQELLSELQAEGIQLTPEEFGRIYTDAEISGVHNDANGSGLESSNRTEAAPRVESPKEILGRLAEQFEAMQQENADLKTENEGLRSRLQQILSIMNDYQPKE